MTRTESVAYDRLTRDYRRLQEQHRALTLALGDLLDCTDEVAWCLAHGQRLDDALLGDLVAASARCREVLA